MRYTLVAVLLWGAASSAAGQSCHSEPTPVGWVPRELIERPIGERTGIGVVTDKVTTTSADAQKFYDQGVAYLHSFV